MFFLKESIKLITLKVIKEILFINNLKNQGIPWWSSGQDSRLSLLWPGSIFCQETEILQDTQCSQKKQTLKQLRNPSYMCFGNSPHYKHSAGFCMCVFRVWSSNREQSWGLKQPCFSQIPACLEVLVGLPLWLL